MAEGIEVRTAKDGSRTYRASVWSNREGKLIRRSFPTEAAVAVKAGRHARRCGTDDRALAGRR